MKLLYNILKAENYRFIAYHPYYKEKLEITLTKYAHNLFFFLPLSKLLLVPVALFNCIVKFAHYSLYYKDKLVSNST